MRIYRNLLFPIAFLLLSACNTTKNVVVTEHRTLPEIIITPPKESGMKYQASKTINFDLIHTQLSVSFDWENQYLFGKVNLTLKPHFYTGDFLWLNARGMEIRELKMIKGIDTIPLKFNYAHDSLGITLDRPYKNNEQFIIMINYISKPEELKDVGGSAYITSDKGLYFINPLGKDPDMPKQIWTQGETQATSVWCPTIDAPNQKTTQEISITIDSIYKTLSNGLLIKSVVNKDGTRTDTWKQIYPHAPYLMMMAIGDYAVVKDVWRGKEVSYYVEKPYEKVARNIFGHTPEMLDYFSRITGVEYPWEKYSQVVVRNYVSGAMENSSATILGEFMQRDERGLLDASNEYFIAHELFHQWFGDMVTCESWSNVALNESFATYGQYLWNEYKYGREEADIELMNDINDYFKESDIKQVDLIRFQYADKEDMFDRHSYEKGGCILHMLRKHIGDDAFFASLKKYLTENKFKTVEIHQLRLAFESITGQDLNWFFNEWFFAKGHPKIDISYAWNEEDKESSVIISQLQDLTTTPLYTIPFDVDIYEKDTIRRERIILNSAKQVFTFHCDTKPDVINVDAEKMLVGIKNDKHSSTEWITLFKKGRLFLDRYEALKKIATKYLPGTEQAAIIKNALSDHNRKIREFAIENIDAMTNSSDSTFILQQLKTIALTDDKSTNRALALEKLDEQFQRKELNSLYKLKLQDSSYYVMKTGMDLLMKNDPLNGLTAIKPFETDTESRVIDMLIGVYSRYGNDNQSAYMLKAIQFKTDGFSAYSRIQQFGKYLSHCENQQTIEKGLLQLMQTGKNTLSWYKLVSAKQALIDLSEKFTNKIKSAELNGNSNLANTYLHLKTITDKYVDDLTQIKH